MKRVVLVTNIPNPYRVPLFNEMHRLFISNNLELEIIFAAEKYKRRYFQLDRAEFKFKFHILTDKSASDSETGLFNYTGLVPYLKKIKPDIIIVNGFSSATMKCLFLKFTAGIPYIIYSGSVETKTRNTGFIRGLQRKILIRFASAFIAYGTRARQYLEARGAKPSSIFRSMNTVDTHFFSEKTAALRNKNNYKGITRFTYVGYLIPRKNVSRLLESVKLLSQARRDFVLDILGDGSELETLKAFTRQNNLNDVVEFHGFRQKDELPAFFSRSSGFLFQTDFDIWGLVLNEAMAAGVPCLSSHNAGATYDLIKDGETGFVVDFNNYRQVADKMNWLIEHKAEAAMMGKKASEFINKEISIEKSATSFLHAVNHVLKNNN